MERNLEKLLANGDELVHDNIIGKKEVEERMQHLRGMWEKLKKLGEMRRDRLLGAVDYYQFFADSDDVDVFMLDTLRLVSSEDVGKDETSCQSLIKKHDVSVVSFSMLSIILAHNLSLGARLFNR